MTARPGLSAYLGAAVARPWEWGVHDCQMWPADWVRSQTGQDPASAWRGRYRSLSGAERIIRRGGGLPALVSAGMGRIGLPEIAPALAEDGDVGLVHATVTIGNRVRVRDVGAIRVAGGWAVLTDDGCVVGPFEAVVAWRVPCHR